MITNIIDRRKRKYRFRKINAIVEAAWHDNACEDSDQIQCHEGPDYREREHISLADAIKWASEITGMVTLFIYDEDDGIYISRDADAERSVKCDHCSREISIGLDDSIVDELRHRPKDIIK